MKYQTLFNFLLYLKTEYIDWFCTIPFLTEFFYIWLSICYLFCCFFYKFKWWSITTLSTLHKLLFKVIQIIILINIYNLINNSQIREGLFFNETLINIYYTWYFKTILLIIVYNVMIQWVKFLNENTVKWISILDFPFLFLGSNIFLLVLLSVNNFFVASICIIGMNICFYVLIAVNFFWGHFAIESCAKYFVLSALSTGLILGGFKEIYLTCGSLQFSHINDFYIMLTTDALLFDKIFILKNAMFLIFAGFLFKLSAAPNHFWAPEIYEALPYSLVSFIILPIKFVFGILFLRSFKIIFTIFAYSEYDNCIINNEIEILLVITIIFSMIIGGINAVFEKRIKHFIAYSSINQIGFLLIGLLGTNSSIQGIQAFIYFFIVYVINLLIFLGLIAYYIQYNYFIVRKKKYIEYIPNIEAFNLVYLDDFKKIFYTKFYKMTIHYNIKTGNNFVTLHKTKNNVFIALFTLTIISLAGIPPFLGFFGKFYILLYAFKLKYWTIIFVGIITSILSVYYYLKILKIMYFEKPLILKKKR